MTSQTSADGRLIQLFSNLQTIQTSTNSFQAHEAMASFTHGILREYDDYRRWNSSAAQQILAPITEFTRLVHCSQDNDLLFHLEHHGACAATILNAMNRFLSQEGSRACPEFFNCSAICLFRMACHGSEQCRRIYKQGALVELIRMMETFRSVVYIQVVGIATLAVLGRVYTEDCYTERRRSPKDLDLESNLIAQILEAMEFHLEASSRVYIVACNALGTLFGQDSRVFFDGGDVENHIYHRLLYAITFGLIWHADDAVAQGVGHALLSAMVGVDVAEELIEDVEHSHGGNRCAAAA